MLLGCDLSRCDHVDGLTRRDLTGATYEQRWCGTWMDCANCGGFTALIPSKELTAKLAARQQEQQGQERATR